MAAIGDDLQPRAGNLRRHRSNHRHRGDGVGLADDDEGGAADLGEQRRVVVPIEQGGFLADEGGGARCLGHIENGLHQCRVREPRGMDQHWQQMIAGDLGEAAAPRHVEIGSAARPCIGIVELGPAVHQGQAFDPRRRLAHDFERDDDAQGKPGQGETGRCSGENVAGDRGDGIMARVIGHADRGSVPQRLDLRGEESRRAEHPRYEDQRHGPLSPIRRRRDPFRPASPSSPRNGRRRRPCSRASRAPCARRSPAA